ncbi:MAG: HIT family protein [Pseudochelatococcus sp.]|jgi:histidine triad (HIT) family protein|uniref:HIT family protein n=1 Tax=Pseudochelatococcus sp. TaxID=2020869 RepID=UPI003D8B7012
MTVYDSDNVFAKILRGEIPAVKIYEDADILAFMDAMPQGDGHALVIPKAPSRNLLDADPATVATLFRAVQRIARAVRTAFGADGVFVSQYNEPASGQTVFHLHVHIIPRFEGVPLRGHAAGTFADRAVLAEHAARIRAALDADNAGPAS